MITNYYKHSQNWQNKLCNFTLQFIIIITKRIFILYKLIAIFLMSSLEIRVCGRFRIQEKLYEGSSASIYIGKNVQSNTDCAIKCQLLSKNLSLVLNEGRVLQNLQGGVGIPNLLWFGENGDYNFLVTQLLGNSLQDYFQICDRRFSLKTVLMIADKILSSMEFIHYKNYVHRDVKPENFLVGLGRKLHQIYTIDFAFATYFKDPTNNLHRPDEIRQKNFVGTLRFASLNVLKGHRNSQRDDIQSIGLMMIYFLKGQLPWQDVQGQTALEKKQNILKIAQKISLDELCEDLPIQIKLFMEYCRGLKYEQQPDFNYLKRLLKQKFVKQGYQYDNIYDWILIPLRLKDTDISNRVPLSRFTKKQNSSLSMCNFQYQFGEDRAYQDKINQQKKKNPVQEVIQPIKKMQKQKKVQKKGGKQGKQECIIY